MNTPSWLEPLKKQFPGLTLRSEVPYREVTSLGAGGTISVLAEVEDDRQLAELLAFTARNDIRIFILGGGTNLAGSDRPFDGLVIRLSGKCFSEIKPGRKHVTAGTFIRMPELARAAAKCGFGGLSLLTGIPGSLGGALRMNAGANGIEIGSMVLQLCGFLPDGTPWTAEKSELRFNYRSSSVPENVILTGVILELPLGDPDAELAKISGELASRRDREPVGRSAGCTFRNVSTREPAGKLIEQCGLKGYRIGAFSVSERHANYIVNNDPEHATEADYLELLIHIRRAVAEKFGFYLVPEVRFVNPESRQHFFEAVPAPRICLLDGGTSSERDVSLRSGAAVVTALRNGGFDVRELDLKECRVLPEMEDADVVYPVLHGGFGEDGRIQKCMEEKGLRFVGSGSGASLLMMDKIATKKLLDRLSLPTAKWAVVTPEKRSIPEGFTFPIILKVPKEGSTVGIIKVDSASQWDGALDKEFLLAHDILAEAFVEGIEITVPIVDGEVLPAIEIRSPHGFYDYDAKYVYKNGHTQYFCPVESLSAEILNEAGKLARKFYLGAGCRDILRVDFIVGKADSVPYILEGNSLPGCTATSLVPKAAAAAGMSFEKMTSSLVFAALKRPAKKAENAESAESEVPVAVSCRSAGTTALRVRICRCFFRLMLVLCAFPLLLMCWGAFQNQEKELALIVGAPAVALLVSEGMFYWFRKMEKK